MLPLGANAIPNIWLMTESQWRKVRKMKNKICRNEPKNCLVYQLRNPLCYRHFRAYHQPLPLPPPGKNEPERTKF
jgi:hypothetical protein